MLDHYDCVFFGDIDGSVTPGVKVNMVATLYLNDRSHGMKLHVYTISSVILPTGRQCELYSVPVEPTSCGTDNCAGREAKDVTGVWDDQL